MTSISKAVLVVSTVACLSPALLKAEEPAKPAGEKAIPRLSKEAGEKFTSLFDEPLWIILGAYLGKDAYTPFLDQLREHIAEQDKKGLFKSQPKLLKAPVLTERHFDTPVLRLAYARYQALSPEGKARLAAMKQSTYKAMGNMWERYARIRSDFEELVADEKVDSKLDPKLITDGAKAAGGPAESQASPGEIDRTFYSSLSSEDKSKVVSLLKSDEFRERYRSFTDKDERMKFMREEMARVTGKQPPGTASLSKPQSIPEITKGSEVNEGLFRTYFNKEKGLAWLYLRKDQLNREFIYFSHSMDGPPASGHNRGRFDDESIIVFQRVYERMEVVKPHTGFYFDPEHPLSRSADANLSPAVLARESIVASDDGGYLISATSLFLSEKMRSLKPGSMAFTVANPGILGKLNDSKSLLTFAKSYPKNTAFGARYVFENTSPTKEQKDAEDVADARYVTVLVQHSLLEVPDSEGFQPRKDDPRIGYFSTQITDMTSTEVTPWRDCIHRWRLVKKDPGAPISEPVEPITYWMENTTPHEFRPIIERAVLRWNPAFEKAGFKNALVVKMQPDDADWDAGDIRYNVLRWTSSSQPPFGGYGPCFVNPRTGEILGADIMLEFSSISRRILQNKLFSELGLEGTLTEASSLPLVQARRYDLCEAAQGMQMGLLRGNIAVRLRPADKIDMQRLLSEALTKLILHEVGHTLGLNHNFKASHMHDPTSIHNRELTSKVGLYSSVMDYPCVNLAPQGKTQGEFFMTCTGPYDEWAISYGYSTALPDAKAEDARLEAIASRSHEPQLAFGNDSDDMRNVGKGIDPDCMIYDMSADPVAYASQRCERTELEVQELFKTIATPGSSYQELLSAYAVLTKDITDALNSASRYIGGVQVERAKHGQGANRQAFTAVPKEKQQQAMEILARHAFSPKAWSLPVELAAHLQKQRRGFDHRDANEDPQLHDRVLKIQQGLLSHLLHSATLQRLVDSQLYGGTYDPESMLAELTTAIFAGDAADKTISPMRRNLQADYLDRLLAIVTGSSHKPSIQGAALAQVQIIERTYLTTPAFNASAGHAALLGLRIRRALDPK